MTKVDTVGFPDLLESVRTPQPRTRPTVFFDIETAPADLETLKLMYDSSKVKLPEHPGVFDPTKVRYGNTKDPAKRASKLNDERGKHFQKVMDHEQECKKAQQDAWNTYVEKAALNPETARVIAVGYGIASPHELTGDAENPHVVALDIDNNCEERLLINFWSVVEAIRARGGRLVTFNGNKFDIPMMTNRSFVLDVDCPYLLTKYNKLEDYCVDALDRWRMGRYGGSGMIGLDKLAKLLGVTGKLEGMTGDQFHQVLKEDRRKAELYLEHDVVSLIEVSKRMRIA